MPPKFVHVFILLLVSMQCSAILVKESTVPFVHVVAFDFEGSILLHAILAA